MADASSATSQTRSSLPSQPVAIQRPSAETAVVRMSQLCWSAAGRVDVDASGANAGGLSECR